MKPWARSFYNGSAWKKCRAAYIASVFGMCERCPRPGHIVHHKKYLTPENINNPAVSLNHALLEYLCQDCHNKEHHGSLEPVIREGLAFDPYGNLIQVEVE
ncbi:HNH endonuclease [Paenibacillus methanolicus]|uniref:HNH endonuclease n=1 Tax=Paenibacillus methanolicus TaxID=582686 RepID=A0A5S5BNF2_9BACL|nr:HNH endonuclease [Paenibacillus methanolicus]TYP67682.1 hypothetical protein BCM02_1237 [Paenibacillus methanolicus]